MACFSPCLGAGSSPTSPPARPPSLALPKPSRLVERALQTLTRHSPRPFPIPRTVADCVVRQRLWRHCECGAHTQHEIEQPHLRSRCRQCQVELPAVQIGCQASARRGSEAAHARARKCACTVRARGSKPVPARGQPCAQIKRALSREGGRGPVSAGPRCFAKNTNAFVCVSATPKTRSFFIRIGCLSRARFPLCAHTFPPNTMALPSAALWVESTAAIEEDDAAAPDAYRVLRPAPAKDTARTKSHKSMDAETGTSLCCVRGWKGVLCASRASRPPANIRSANSKIGGALRCFVPRGRPRRSPPKRALSTSVWRAHAQPRSETARARLQPNPIARIKHATMPKNSRSPPTLLPQPTPSSRPTRPSSTANPATGAWRAPPRRTRWRRTSLKERPTRSPRPTGRRLMR